MRADLAILDRDLFETDPTRIHEVSVVATLVDGQVVYGELR
jgi:predicted amidohydrolase YtcJ